MSEALRTIFAEFGFKVDDAQLEELNKRLKVTADKTKKLPADTDKAAKGTKRLGEESKKAAKEIKSLGDVASGVGDAITGRLGDALRKQSPRIHALAGLFNASSEAVGKVFVGATLAAVGAMGLGIHAAVDFANAFSEQSEALRDTATDLRITTTQLQEFDHAAAQSGVGVERMRSGITKFSTDLRAAERYGNGTTFLLRRLGIQARDASGHIRPMGDIMDEVAIALPRIENPLRRTRVAVRLFGEAGRRMVDVLHEGPGGIRALRDELEELGGGITPEAALAAREYTRAMERQGRATDSLRSVFATSLLPVLTWVIDKITKAEGWFARLTRGTHLVQVGLVALGIAGAAVAASMIATWAPVLAPFLAAGAAVAGLALAFDDLWTFIEGGDSVLGRFLDKYAGKNFSAQYAHEVREEWKWIAEHIKAAYEYLEKIGGVFTLLSPVSGRIRAALAGLGISSVEGGGAAGAVQRLNASRGRPEVPAGDWSETGAAPPSVRIRPRTGPRLRPVPATVDAPPVGVTFGGNAMRDTGGLFSVAAPVPPTRAVAAPGAVSHNTSSRTIVRQIRQGDINVNGITDPNAVAARVRQIQQEQERAERDAAHPLEDDG